MAGRVKRVASCSLQIKKFPFSLVSSCNQQDQNGNTSLSTCLSLSDQKTVDQLLAKERAGLELSSHSTTQTYLVDSATFCPPSFFKSLLVMRLIFPVAFNSLDLTDMENVTKNLQNCLASNPTQNELCCVAEHLASSYMLSFHSCALQHRTPNNSAPSSQQSAVSE